MEDEDKDESKIYLKSTDEKLDGQMEVYSHCN